MIPRAFVGSGSGIYILDDGHQDAGAALDALLETSPLAPAGPDADCTFDRLFVTLTWTAAANILCTPIVDGVELDDAAFTIALATQAVRRTRVYERVIRVPHLVAAVEAYRKKPRGTWFSLRMETVGGVGEGDLIFDELRLEFLPERPLKERVPL